MRNRKSGLSFYMVKLLPATLKGQVCETKEDLLVEVNYNHGCGGKIINVFLSS